MAKGIKRARRRAKRRAMRMTPQQRYEQLLALKKSIQCLLKVEDRFKMYKNLASDFKDLADRAETEPFEYAAECLEMREECLRIAAELKEQCPKEQKEESRTVTTSAREREKELNKGKKGIPGSTVFLSVVALVLAIVVVYMNVPYVRYLAAGAGNVLGVPEVAKDIYDGLGDYKDSKEKEVEIEKHFLEKAKKGTEIKFGADKWVVLKRTDSAVLLLKQEAFDKRTFHDTKEDVAWAQSSLRTYLNGEFVQKEFSEQEIALIQDTTNVTDGVSTTDKIFILSKEEVKKYGKTMESTKNNMRLRDKGENPCTTKFVSYLGDCVDAGFPVNEKGAAIRPAVWVKYE